MNRQLDDTDARILELIQREFPLQVRPFETISAEVCITPSEALSRIQCMKSEGIIRQISAIFDSASLGYSSALVAFEALGDAIDHVAAAVSKHFGVSHCYSRNSRYNLWFTITVGSDNDLNSEVRKLASQGSVESYMTLPALKVFKIGVFLKMTDDVEQKAQSGKPKTVKPATLSEEFKTAVRALQTDLPLSDRPFAEVAARFGTGENELLENAREFLQKGTMRRYAAVLRHRDAGYRFNAMVCWRVGSGMVEQIGVELAKHPSVSHCYERPVYADWPYALYTMVHSRSKEELARIISQLVVASQNSGYLVLETVAEYKKTRVLYFE